MGALRYKKGTTLTVEVARNELKENIALWIEHKLDRVQLRRLRKIDSNDDDLNVVARQIYGKSKDESAQLVLNSGKTPQEVLVVIREVLQQYVIPAQGEYSYANEHSRVRKLVESIRSARQLEQAMG